MSVVVELMGLPACGKTTIAEALELELRARNVDVHRRTRLREGDAGSGRALGGLLTTGIQRARAAAARPLVVGSSMTHLAGDGRTWRQKVLAARLLLVTLENYDVVSRGGDDDVYVFAEGTGQRAFVVLADGRRPVDLAAARRYVTHMPLPDVLVHLRVSPSECLERTSRRERGLPDRFAGLSGAEAKHLLGDAAGLFDTILDQVRALQPHVVAHEIDSGDLDAAIASAKDVVVADVVRLLRDQTRTR